MNKNDPNTSPSQTPAPQLRVSLNFYDALRELAAGKCISRVSWPAGTYGILRDGKVMIYLASDKQFHDWIINDGDLAGQDWIDGRGGVMPDLAA